MVPLVILCYVFFSKGTPLLVFLLIFTAVQCCNGMYLLDLFITTRTLRNDEAALRWYVYLDYREDYVFNAVLG